MEFPMISFIDLLKLQFKKSQLLKGVIFAIFYTFSLIHKGLTTKLLAKIPIFLC